MIGIAPEKVAHVIVKAREYGAKVAAWEDGSFRMDADSDAILQSFTDDPTRREAVDFISGLNQREQASLVALAWIGRGSFGPDEYVEAEATAREEHIDRAGEYLLGMPLLADYLEEGLEAMGISVEDAEDDIL